MDYRRLGRTELRVSPIAFGAFKIGRNVGIKYPTPYDLPSEADATGLLHGVLDLGINLIDTAPAYGLSEERIGRALNDRQDTFYISTKAGETFVNDVSHFDFSSTAIRRSVQESLRRLQTDVIDILLVHSNGEDEHILEATDAPATVCELRDAGLVRAVGFSGKTVDGAETALAWADVLMVEYHPLDTSHLEVIAAARDADVGVLVKKPLAAGRLAPADALPFILDTPGVTAVVVGGLRLDHMKENVRLADGQ